ALLHMDDNVAVAMGWPEIVQPHSLVRQMEREVVGKGLARRTDHYGIIVAQIDAPLEPAARWIVVRHHIENILAEQKPDPGRKVADRPGVTGARPEGGLHRSERLLMR